MIVLLPLLTRWFFYLVYTMENNYSVYQHVTPDGMYYFGQTQNVERRWSNNGAGYKGTALYPYIEKFGWDNIKHIVLFKDQTRENALWIEDFLITTAQEDGVCINKKRSGLVSKEEGYNQEYYQQNKDKIKQYYETNKEQIREKQNQYYETNKEQIREKQNQYHKKYYEQNKDKKREYQEQNKDKIRKYQREYNREYQRKNRDKINEYHRQYRQRKKLEKQLKEVQTTLF